MMLTEKLQRVARDAAKQRCIEPACSAHLAFDERLYVCPRCGGLLDVALEGTTDADPEQLRAVWTARLASFVPRDRLTAIGEAIANSFRSRGMPATVRLLEVDREGWKERKDIQLFRQVSVAPRC